MEEWKPISLIPGYEEYVNYEMNTEGILRRTVAGTNARAGHVLIPDKGRRGYLRYVLCSHGKTKHLSQHRAIACLFIPNPEQYESVDHINRLVNDNRIENLRWCSSQQNSCNKGVPSTNATGYKNIYKYCQRGKYWCWCVAIWVNGTPIRKQFKCEPDDTEPPAKVIAMRDQMLKELHGEFARTS